MSGEELFKLSLMMDSIVDAGMDVGMSPIEGAQVARMFGEEGNEKFEGRRRIREGRRGQGLGESGF